MADAKISQLTTATPAAADLLPIVDVSDTSMGPGGSTRKATVASLPFDATGTAAAAVTTHEGATDPHPQYTTAAELAAALASALAGYQPLNSDLTAIAALTTTTFGRALLTLLDAAAGRAALDVPSTGEVTAEIAAAAPSIGAPVTGGTAGRVLFLDGSANLAQDAVLTYAAGVMSVPRLEVVCPTELTGATILSAGIGSGAYLTLYDNGFLVINASVQFPGTVTFDNPLVLTTGLDSSSYVQATEFYGNGVTLTGVAVLTANTFTGAQTIRVEDSGTTTALDVLLLSHNSSGTPSTNFGTAVLFQGNSSTTDNTSMGRLTYTWATATHASRKARSRLTVFDTAEREVLRGEASGSAPMIGFLGATAVVRPSGTGETVGFTAGAGTNVTDASTFTGNVGSTAYRISDIVKAMKNLGLLAQ